MEEGRGHKFEVNFKILFLNILVDRINNWLGTKKWKTIFQSFSIKLSVF